MAKVLTDGKTKIGAYMFSDRKKPCLCIAQENSCVVYGTFQSVERANEFMDALGQLVGAEIGGKGKNE